MSLTRRPSLVTGTHYQKGETWSNHVSLISVVGRLIIYTYFLVLGLATPGTAAPSTASAASTAPAATTSAKTSAKPSSTTGVVRHLLHGLNKMYSRETKSIFRNRKHNSESVVDFNQMKPRRMAAMFDDRDIHSILTNCSFSTSVNYSI